MTELFFVKLLGSENKVYALNKNKTTRFPGGGAENNTWKSTLTCQLPIPFILMQLQKTTAIRIQKYTSRINLFLADTLNVNSEAGANFHRQDIKLWFNNDNADKASAAAKLVGASVYTHQSAGMKNR